MTHRPDTWPVSRLDVSDLPSDGYITFRLEHVFHLALLAVTAIALLVLLLNRVGAVR